MITSNGTEPYAQRVAHIAEGKGAARGHGEKLRIVDPGGEVGQPGGELAVVTVACRAKKHCGCRSTPMMAETGLRNAPVTEPFRLDSRARTIPNLAVPRL